MTPKTPVASASTFSDLGINPKILAVLERAGFVTPTPIQNKVIPLGIQGKDIIGIAETGTGKTLAFGIPMIERLLANENGRGLVLLPTRELALQVGETLRKIGETLGIYSVVLIGGDPMYRQIRELRNGPSIVIATPGRLIDHLKQKNLKLDRVSVLVLDEADHMFDIGFAPQIREIMKQAPKVRQTMLFSATMPNEIAKLAMENMALPLRIEMSPAGTAAKNVDQEIIVVNRNSKFSLLIKTLGEVPSGTPVLVFTRTKHEAKDIASDLRDVGTSATEIHSNRSLSQRREALDGFKKHKYQILVATDIAARGIDVKDIGLVVNYDLPEKSEDYVHRIGRTGRAGKSGKAVSFATPSQKYDVAEIERLMKRTIPTKSHEGATISSVGAPRASSYRGRGGQSSSGSRGGFRGESSRGFSSTPRSYSASAPRSYGTPRSATSSSRSFSSAPRSFGNASPRRFGAPASRFGTPSRRFAPPGAFRVHTNQAFKGGAPRKGSR